MSNKEYTFFWGGIYSQWYASKFVIANVEYNCAEQYMMAEKARFFGDKEAEDAIMASNSPMTQKKIGREVRNFDVTEWSKVARGIVYDANYAKFTQNQDLLEQLLADDTYIVEASPYDTIWGIGMSEFDPDRFDETKWRGSNWLGLEIMRVRDALKVTVE